MTTLAALRLLIAQGECETLEFTRAAAELRCAGEALCAFLNGEGGQATAAGLRLLEEKSG